MLSPFLILNFVESNQVQPLVDLSFVYYCVVA